MDLITVKPKMLCANIDLNLIENDNDRDFFTSLFLVAGAIGNNITCSSIDALGNLSKKTIEIIKKVGGIIENDKGCIKARRSAIMQGVNINCVGYEEILPFIALLCAFCSGESHLTGVKDTKYSSLLKGIASEFSHLGVLTEQIANGIIIRGRQPFSGDGAYVWNSAEIAMTLIIGASRSEGEIRVFGIEGINNKRFDDFLKLTII